jgi:hypothetical protein
MRKLNVLLFIGALALSSSCKKEENEPTPPTPTPTAQTKTLPVYISPIPLNLYLGGVAPMVKITEVGTTNEFTFLVNTCDNVNGNSFTITYGKSYSVVFGSYNGGQWTQTGGNSGTMTIANDGQISGNVGSNFGITKGTDYQGCGFTITGEILLFY